MKILTSFELKVIALLSMFIDHVGFLFFPNIQLFRIVGRGAFVLYAFMLVEGTFYTSNINTYLKKLLIWGLLSEIPFDLFFNRTWFSWESQNVFFTLLLGGIGILFIKRYDKNVLKIIVAISTMILAYFMRVDYSWYGVGLIYVFYLFRNLNALKFLYAELLSLIFACTNVIQIFALVGFIPICLYNEKLGPKIGNIYYSFYALHLLILCYCSSIIN